MSYGVHVTRRAEDWEPRDDDISLEEWRDAVEADTELQFDGDVRQATLPNGQTMQMKNANGFYVWHGPAGEVTLTYSDGRVSTSNPDSATIAKLLDIAARLRAGVRGDEGETY